ncbi:ANR family transcriptional regulator [Serratia fonticola]|uniref:ANR family transcriptional regulator n=1 Tax=Serratia fonticola TaxID=47917 RepID=UPI0015C5E170|nr:ANR family transcriptional regulator [Serratia fonticola]NYA16514.1 ANR family transcriptional regulator [Serratia fonticola]NYA36637.1 ANR family transcriptional regulator [Serratia fonticola]
MESLNKTETLRQALSMIGPATSKKLEEFTGFPASRIGPLLTSSTKSGAVVCGWEGHKRLYGLPGQLKPAKDKPVFVPAVHPRRVTCHNAAFQNASNLAAKAEQACLFDRAANLWREAADLSVTPDNFNWCESRELYCKRWGLSILQRLNHG